jgi:hypothetical protein
MDVVDAPGRSIYALIGGMRLSFFISKTCDFSISAILNPRKTCDTRFISQELKGSFYVYSHVYFSPKEKTPLKGFSLPLFTLFYEALKKYTLHGSCGCGEWYLQ